MNKLRFQCSVFFKERPLPKPDTPVESSSSLINAQVRECLQHCAIDTLAAKDCIRFEQGMPPRQIGEEVRKQFGVTGLFPDEGYVIKIGQDDIAVYARTERGLFYGSQSLIHLLRQESFQEGLVYDYPVCPVRGMKVFLPAREQIGNFKRFVDMACSYKYNTIMIEIGGAMEYRSHPEINEGWEEYCKFMNEYPGKTQKIQGQYPWNKNSIHSENGGGSFLSQEEVRDLVAYCRERHIELVPEVPSLSHCDYLLTRHPELAERIEDPYPDTYCPSNPKSYELLFDVLDEVTEVFNPRIINVGHDEFYTMARCPLCKCKTGVELYSGDINRIHEHLSKKHVKTMIWGEKLINAHFKDGYPIGGAESPVYFNEKLVETRMATFPAIDKISSDIEIMHWYWGIERSLEEEYYKRDMQVTFGNFQGVGFPEWRKRIAHKGCKGAIISNWGAMNELTLQRNGILFDMVFSSAMFWNRNMDENNYQELSEWTLKELFTLRRYIRFSPGQELLEIVHTTEEDRPFKGFCDGFYVDESQFLLGHHIVHFSNGKKLSVPVVFGSNISTSSLNWGLMEYSEGGHYGDRMLMDSHLAEISFETLPFKEGDRTFYRIELANPFPGEKVTSVEFQGHKPGCHVELKSLTQQKCK